MTAPYDLAILNARIVGEDRDVTGGLAVKDGWIAALLGPGETPEAAETIDAAGRVLMPGLVDGHVHFSEPGRGHWEGFETGSHAAAAGGITTFVEMPLNAHPPTINAEALRLKQAEAEKSIVDYAISRGSMRGSCAPA